MLTHIVVFKYKPEVDEPTRERHRKQLGSLARLDGVVSLTVGADLLRGTRSYDTALVVVFPDRAALDVYAVNPHHVPVADFGKSLCAHIATVDFEES